MVERPYKRIGNNPSHYEKMEIELNSLKGIREFCATREVDLLNDEEVYQVLEQKGALMRFVIEKIDEDELSFCFYGEMNGDLMRDPEITCKIKKKGDKVVLIPLTFQNDYVGCYDVVAKQIGEKLYTKSLREMKGVCEVLKNMSLNLEMRAGEF